MTKETVPASDEAWDERELGADEAFVKVVDDRAVIEAIDEASGTQLISIRVQKSLVEDFKLIASLNNIGYQTLMKQIMQRFAECEKKKILRDLIAEKLNERKEAVSSHKKPVSKEQRKAA